MRAVDTHAHAFVLAGRMAASRRYTPRRDSPLSDYIIELDQAGIAQAVLVQPSFLGTDNSYLVSCLCAYPDRLRGIAVVDPSWGGGALARLGSAGIVGIRLNLLGLDTDFLSSKEWQDLFGRVAALGWQIEVHDQGRRIPTLLDALWPCGARIVIDHFGRPEPGMGLDDPGVRAITRSAGARRIWVKLSGPYRCLGDAASYARHYLQALGPDRLLWGSDWPWTQHEDGLSYGPTRDWLDGWIPDPLVRAAILDANPRALFAFDAPMAAH